MPGMSWSFVTKPSSANGTERRNTSAKNSHGERCVTELGVTPVTVGARAIVAMWNAGRPLPPRR
jgi:hypothetical protein